MNAAAESLRAYLAGQADLGTEEVILPHPWRPAPAQVALAQAQARRPAMEAVSGPAYREAAALPESTQAPAGLFETLSRALDTPKAVPAATASPGKPRATETAAMPTFADLGAFWSHLEANPGLAAGAGDASVQVTRVVRAAGAAGAPLALVGLEPGEADLAAGLAFQGEAGALLGKMLKAIRLEPDLCYRTNLVKAARAARPSQVELSRLGKWLQLELSLVRAPVVLLLGEACARAVLKLGKSIEEMRQEPFFIEGREFAVTWHPSELLQREELKRKAWEDLQWLRKRISEGRN